MRPLSDASVARASRAHALAPCGDAAIPVTVFINTCFMIANDNEAPESWLEWTGWRKFVFGFNAHRRWNYTLDTPPLRYIRWYVRSHGAPVSETAANLCRSLHALATKTEPFWVLEAREAAAEEAGEAPVEDGAQAGDAKAEKTAAPAEEDGEKAGSVKSAASTSSSVRSAKALSAYKRQVAVVGLLAAFVCWAIFVWYDAPRPSSRRCGHDLWQATLTPSALPFPLCTHAGSYSLVRCCAARLLARAAWRLTPRNPRARAQTACSSSACWATTHKTRSRAPGASATASTRRRRHVHRCAAARRRVATQLTRAPVTAPVQWKDIAHEAAKAAIVLAVLERLFLTPNASWLEARGAGPGRARLALSVC